ncbi:OsmC family protein [Microlunatus aurantiacus]|uniref:OsmC family protein n=1 Tax=Microlunatus aurantiacus TaxID=446786 RepID=A0ABP7DAZ8_9ACTN
MSDAVRRVRLERTSRGRLLARNERGATMAIGMGEDSDFTPVELLLVAIAGCSAIDVDLITGKRSAPDEFVVDASGVKIRDQEGNRLVELAVDFRVRFPDTDGGRAAESVLERAITASHDRLCTVTRTVEVGTPVTSSLRGERVAGPSATPEPDGPAD